MVGGRIGKDGIHGATFSSLALDHNSPSSAVQLGDPITQKRAGDFLLEARELGFYRAITDNGAGGLSSSVGELARLSGGARMDVSRAKTKYPGLKPYELVISESQERMTLAIPPSQLEHFIALAERRGVEVSDLGEFTNSGRFEIFYGDKIIANLDLEFLHKGVPQLELDAKWEGRKTPATKVWKQSFERDAAHLLIELLSRPNIASKEWLIRQYDHEVQGMSVVKPLNTSGVGTLSAWSGPNDGGVLKPKPNSEMGMAVGCGINTRLSDIDPYLMAQASVDEAVRNVLCVGAEYGRPESVLALVDNFCWPDPVGNPEYSAALVRACYGLRDAALALGTPLVSGKDSMKNDYRGSVGDKPVKISVPPTLLMTAVAKVHDIGLARTADFKAAGDVIYVLGGTDLGLLGSELHAMLGDLPENSKVGEPHWKLAQTLYGWVGGAHGREQKKLRSLHDISEGGLLVALSEGLLARGLGAKIQLPQTWNSWEGCFGEGFHSFVASVGENDTVPIEAEWHALKVPYVRIGVVSAPDRLEIQSKDGMFTVPTKQLRAAWMKEGYWE
jgi:phosphoribosylformylglycinamidine synthase